ncbi:MAG: hypothetical protein VYC39_10570 [Myxococcota bacterium]|nr:hypothetical protein [Myxococcota bacterium]
MGMNIGSNNNLFHSLGYAQGLQQGIESALAANPHAALSMLQGGFGHCATGFGQFSGANLPPFGQMPSPGMMRPVMGPICGGGYSGGFERLDLAPGTKKGFFSRLFNRKRRGAAKLERLLSRNPTARAAFEQGVGGRIVSDGKRDGVLTIQRFAPGARPAPMPGFAANPMANSAIGCLHGMEHSVMRSAGKLGLIGAGVGGVGGALQGLMMGTMMGNPFGGLMMGGLGGLVSGGLGGASMGMMGMGGMGMMGMGGGLGMGGFGALPMLGGGGMGSWNPLAMPGRINNTNPLYEMAHQGQVTGVMMDPSLTVEDKVTLMLMLIMKKMDRDIQRQAQYINAIQQQQSKRNGKGKALGGLGTAAGFALGGPMGAKAGGGVGGKMGGGMNSPSIDVETMKLKRMIDKRSQMFDMLRQIIDKYNETAKGIIQSIGR